MNSQEFTPQQYRKFNGQSIMLALESLGGSATADTLAEHIATMIDQPQDIVKAEVSIVLRRGISNGFFQRRGKEYFLFSESSLYDVDGGKRKRKSRNGMQTDGGRKRVRFSHQDEDDDELKSQLDRQSISGLQEIIAKANDDTKEATILATTAAKRAKLASMKILEIVESEDNMQND